MTVVYSTGDSGLPLNFSTWRWFYYVIFRWRGNVVKMVAIECVLVVVAWFIVKHYLGAELANVVEFLRGYQNGLRGLLSFMLVFFYQQIYARAVKIFWLLPFPDEPLFMANSMIGFHPQAPPFFCLFFSFPLVLYG